MQLSKKQKTTFEIVAPFVEYTSSIEHFRKKR